MLSGTGLAVACDGPGARDASGIPARAAAGEEKAIAALERHAHRLARALATVVNLIDPDVIVLGGALSNMTHLYEQIPQLLPRSAFREFCSTPVVRNAHGDSSGVRGSLALAAVAANRATAAGLVRWPHRDATPEATLMEILKPELATGALAVRELPPDELARLEGAMKRLRGSRGVVVRAADLLASALGPAASLGLRQLSVPPALLRKAHGLAEAALRRAFDLAVVGVRPHGRRRARLGDRMGRIAAATSGAVGGFAGFSGFLPDVTLTTLLIMRRIAAIAAEEGEDLSTEEARAACLEVFALDAGEPSEAQPEGDAEVRYWTARFMLQGRPVVLLISEIAASYGLRVSQKLALQAVPLVGAAGGALVNSAFLDHYQTLARVHFTIRRLERTYGRHSVRAACEGMKSK